MKYISEINAFYDWLELNELSTSAIALWHTMMHINNKAGWVETFTVAESVLSIKTGLSGRGVRNARNELKQKGRIDFKSRTGGRAPTYTIISFEDGINCLDKKTTEKAKETDSEEKSSTEINSTGTSADSAGDTSAGASVDSATLIDKDLDKDKDLDNVINNDNKESWVYVIDYYCEKANKLEFNLKPQEREEIQSICKTIPLEIIFKGIEQAFKNHKPRFNGDKINSFAYCAKVIKSLWAVEKDEGGVEDGSVKRHNGIETDKSGIGLHL